jgi:hypothetical protein
MTVEAHERRRPLLIAALGFAFVELRQEPAALTTLKHWLNSWSGIGAVIAGMTRQGFNVEARQFPEGWRVNFYPAGIAHSVVVGSGWAKTPGTAVQQAAWEALSKPDTA